MIVATANTYKSGDLFPIRQRFDSALNQVVQCIQPAVVIRDSTFDEYVADHPDYIDSIGGVNEACQRSNRQGSRYYLVSTD